MRLKFKVEGESMLPGLSPGSFVLGKRITSNRISILNIDDIIVFFDQKRSRTMVKRIQQVNNKDHKVHVIGDNTQQSALIDPVDFHLIIAQVTSVSSQPVNNK